MNLNAARISRLLFSNALWTSLIVLIFCTCLFEKSSQGAESAKRQSAEDLIASGLELRQQGRDTEALDLFRRAYEISKDAKAMAQIGLAEQAIGSWIQAEKHLSQALKTTKHPWIKTHKKALTEAMTVIKDHLGDIDIIGGIAGAEVKIDGELIGTLPLTRQRVVAGTIVLEVTREGYWPVSRKVLVPANGLARESINLVEKPKNSEIDSNVLPKSDFMSAKSNPVMPVQRDDPTYSIMGWSLFGAGSVSTVIGLSALIIQRKHASRYNSDACLLGPGTREQNCSGAKRAADKAATWATIGFVGGVAFFAGSLVVFLLEPAHGVDETTANISPIQFTSGPGDFGLSAHVSF